MSLGPQRTFSFERGDERSLNSNDREHQGPNISPVPSPLPPLHTSYAPSHNQVSPIEDDEGPPLPPAHGHRRMPSSHQDKNGRYWGQELGYTQSARTNSTVTPGMDNLGVAAAGGGISGIALGVANSNDRESGVNAMRGMGDMHNEGYRGPPERDYNTTGSDNPYIPASPYADGSHSMARDSNSSSIPLAAAVAPAAGQSTPPHPMSYNLSPYGGSDGPYQRQSFYGSGHSDPINPDDIADDGDDGFIPEPKRKTMLGLGGKSSHDALPAAAGGAAAGGVLGGLLGRQKNGAAESGPSYGPVPGAGLDGAPHAEKSEWLNNETQRRKKMRWFLWVGIGFLIAAAIAGAVVGGVIGSRKSKSGSSSPASGSTGSASSDTASNGDLDKNSKEIQALMNNANLHKVFPGMDYTPWGTQYPLCLKYPPSQNNVTRDLAVLSQLTNQVRLYGTDCNQTEMVLHAIDKLGLTDMKVWLGVWLDTNTTTNERQLELLYKVLQNTSDKSIFKGAIIGNEALYRAGSTKAEAQRNLINYIHTVRSNFTELKVDMPVATSDLGDNWNTDLADAVDIVMSNVHPFFGGVPVDEAAGWAYSFWQSHDVPLTAGTNKQQIIAEIGWPSGGGNDCGTDAACTDSTSGSVSGIDEMNKFMDDWVCQALANGTDYFWFEAFDEPWKVIYNTPGMAWEDKWGLMDPGRNLKTGLKIPDCGGKSVS